MILSKIIDFFDAVFPPPVNTASRLSSNSSSVDAPENGKSNCDDAETVNQNIMLTVDDVAYNAVQFKEAKAACVQHMQNASDTYFLHNTRRIDFNNVCVACG